MKKRIVAVLAGLALAIGVAFLPVQGAISSLTVSWTNPVDADLASIIVNMCVPSTTGGTVADTFGVCAVPFPNLDQVGSEVGSPPLQTKTFTTGNAVTLAVDGSTYFVSALDGNGNESGASNSASLDLAPPAAPTAFSIDTVIP